MEHGRRESGPERTPRSHETRQRKSTKRKTGRRVGFVLGTILLIGICTAAMIVGIFMTYVKTTLTPTLQVRAEDYTMNLSRCKSSHIWKGAHFLTAMCRC